MSKKSRPVPFPVGSEARRRAIAAIRKREGLSYWEAVRKIAEINRIVRNRPLHNERCGARTRKGTPCQCKALRNGRCKLHGGLSTGAKTPEGRRKVYGHE